MMRLAAAIVCFNTGYSIYFFLFNFFLSSQGRDEHWMGLLQGALILGSVFGSLPAGLLANRLGLRPTLALSLLLSALLLSSITFFESTTLQIISAFCSGFFLSAWTVLIFPAMAAQIKPIDRSTVFPWLYGLGVASGCLGALLGGWLPVLFSLHTLQARQAVLLFGAFLIAASCLFLPADQPEASVARLARPEKRFLPLLLTSALFAFFLGSFNPFSGVFFASRFQLSVKTVGNFFSVVQILTALALWKNPAARRLSSAPLLCALQLLAGVLLAALALPSLPTAALCYLLFMLAQQLAQPALQTLCMNQPTAHARTTVASWNTLGCALAQAAATPLAGCLFRSYGYGGTLPLLGLLTAACAFLWLLLQASPASTEASAEAK